MFFFISYISYGSTCIAIGSGDWDDPSIWSCGHVPASTDSIIIPAGITVTITANTFHDGYILIEGELVSNPKTTFTIGPNGTLNNYGNMLFQGEIINQGEFYNYSYISSENIINSVNFINSNGAEIFVNKTFEVEGNGYVENYGSITTGKDFQIQDNGNVHNYGSLISQHNLEVKGNGSLTNHSGGYIEVLNDVKIKNNGMITNELGSNFVVCDDFHVVDNGIFQNDGLLKICAICVGSKYEEHELMTKPNTALLGNGQICMCDATYNQSNVVDTLGYVDPNITISNGTNGDCSTPLPIYAVNLYGQMNHHVAYLRVETITDIPVSELIIECKLESESEWVPIVKEADLSIQDVLSQTFRDEGLPASYSGYVYYRAKLTDVTGDIVYSNVIRLQVTASSGDVFVFPNPISGQQIFQIHGITPSDQMQVALFTIDGKELGNGIIEVSPGTYQCSTSIVSGTYLIRVQTREGSVFWARVIVQP